MADVEDSRGFGITADALWAVVAADGFVHGERCAAKRRFLQGPFQAS